MTKYDLMPGDIVRLRFANNTTTIIRVYEILDHGVAFVNRGKQFANFSATEPIELTPTILGKNGWIIHNRGEKNEWYGIDIYLDKHKSIQLTLNESILMWGDKTEDELEYPDYILPAPKNVHELQHILRLCGLTSQADKFKV